MNKKRLIIIGIIVLVIAVSVFFIFGPETTGQVTGNPADYRYVPLSQAEVQKVANTILSSEFVKDIPEKDPVGLTFYSFDDQGRYWRDSFLIGKDQLLTQGTPSAYLMLHSKYVEQIDSRDLCSIIKEANSNGDLAFESDYGTAKLLIKYAGMLKHRNCFGF